jgi:hypothetical protein
LPPEWQLAQVPALIGDLVRSTFWTLAAPEELAIQRRAENARQNKAYRLLAFIFCVYLLGKRLYSTEIGFVQT